MFLGFVLSLSLAQPASGDKSATIIVKVPAGATVFIGSQKMTRTGTERHFTTPPLPVGTYSYEVLATWDSAIGLENTSTKTVVFSPGETVTVDFLPPPPPSDIKVLPKKLKSRSVQITYAGAVTDLPPGSTARVWLPLPQSHDEQTVVLQKMSPADHQIRHDKQYGNAICYFEVKPDVRGEAPFKVEMTVTRDEVTTGFPAAEKQETLARFLAPDAKVPIAGKPLELLKSRDIPPQPTVAAKVMYDVVNAHMKYSKEGTGWGQGDSLWACDSKFGNCTDFHSLFISMARGHKIPAKFEIGFSLPTEKGEGTIAGYHCWAWFLDGGKWIPVDISEANRHPELKDYYFGRLTADRIHFTTGRDIDLEPRQAGPPLNFLIFPYVEVDGRPYAAEKVRREIAYRDVGA